jgi:hypothetical protein
MRKRKVIAIIVLAAIVALIGYCWVEFCGGPILSWRVVSVRPHQYYYAVDHLQECWEVQIEISNLTSDEVIVDWNRDQSAFQVGGHWEDLHIGALMPYLPPNESRTFPVDVPQNSQACRLQMYYEHGPLWSTIDGYFKDHDIYLSDGVVIPAMKVNKRLPGHFKRLDIEVKLPPNTALEPTGVGAVSSASRSTSQPAGGSAFVR